jgi:hypothetical protein
MYEEKQRWELLAILSFNISSKDSPWMTRALLQELSVPTVGEHAAISAAWGPEGFSFLVRGKDKIARLRPFVEALKAGKAELAPLADGFQLSVQG